MDEAPLVDPKEKSANDHADLFKAMAERILLNKDGAFGGAVVILPPDDGGEPVDFFLLSEQSPIMFWASLKSIIEAQIANLNDAARRGQFGR